MTCTTATAATMNIMTAFSRPAFPALIIRTKSRQKVALAGALVHDPKLIILDEPLTGLDAGSARLVKDVLLERVNRGCSVIMTTHILEVAERMAERIGVISNGRLIAEGTLERLREQSGDENGTLEDVFLGLVEGDASSESVAA